MGGRRSTTHEAAATSKLLNLMDTFPPLAESVLKFPWLNDECEWRYPVDEGGIVALLTRIAEVDLTLAKRVAGLAWVVDGIDADEVRALQFIYDTSRNDVHLGEQVAGLAILADGLSELELRLIGHLNAWCEL